MQLTDLLRGAGIDALDIGVVASIEVTGLSVDSSRITPGTLFAALPGRRTHGAVYVDAAVAAGAVAVITDSRGRELFGDLGVPVVIVDQPRIAVAHLASTLWGNPATTMTMIGVTGTNGKTTVTHLIQAVLTESGRPCAVMGTLGTSLPGVVDVPHARTTPEAPDVHSALAVLRDAGADAVAMEVSSIALREHRVDGIVFDIAVFTGLSHDHLDYHGSMDAYFEAKADLFDPQHAGRAVVVIDDPWGRALLERLHIPAITVTTTGAQADWRASLEHDHIKIDGPESFEIQLPVPTHFAAANLLTAIAVASFLGIPARSAARAAVHARVPGRMEVVRSVGDVDFVVDYAHTPDAVRQVVAAAAASRRIRGGRVIAVLGAGGDRDPSKRGEMGRAAAEGADLLFITDDNPRSEEPGSIRAAVKAGADGIACQVSEIADRGEAIGAAVDHAQPNDIVLVLGKGHEASQEFADHVLAFDDRLVLASFVEARYGEVKEEGRR